jgi:hypothetical protein
MEWRSLKIACNSGEQGMLGFPERPTKELARLRNEVGVAGAVAETEFVFVRSMLPVLDAVRLNHDWLVSLRVRPGRFCACSGAAFFSGVLSIVVDVDVDVW